MKNKNLPNGTRDEFGVQAEVKEAIQMKLLGLFKDRGFRKLTTPVLEYSDVFEPLSTDNYRPYQFLDEQGETLVLRPDLTLPVARVMSTTGVDLPVKWYYSGDVFRVKRRLSGSYNQTTQAGIEIIGYKGIKADWECLQVALSGCQQMGLEDVTVEISQAKFVDTVINQLELPEPTRNSLKMALFDKDLNRYQSLWSPLVHTKFEKFLAEWPWLFGDFDQVIRIVETLPRSTELEAIIKDLIATKSFINQQFPNFQVTLDLSVRSPQSYYTGMAFRGFTGKSADYLFSGGRYDDLLTNFQKVKVSAVGVAFDVDALVERTALPANKQQTLIYFDDDQWQLAEKKLQEIPNSTLCLTQSVQAAKRLADSDGNKLLDLTEGRSQNGTN
ncbi:ATP phosphoribosyltransferase regulatory subunit [Lentilactobacillus hilgardii]|nr:ATP phosphoribosyltransferase regulatory subunit [Lentilactobacillus hilgardii]KRK57981.1 ATP phosphoribosyltransferase for histidine biosynthesis [Lentilactobacillus hilgardii DSM 20176 = ATCC 8290]MCP9332892.1 ATP phosphoribosyltransferase regulatory subunit [Lentilactobacillus hilgardii]MCP9349501.1 ATP phosphoribosyltransferase regulatory subunit [Lentilactobacillus hilgardii]MCP9352369.1 ATP phosphoribosyltransferase regulatory subunit [Lentilactobacillus hilgardii]QEU38232.1 ATP phosp